MTAFVVLGVSGSGKSAVGAAAAAQLRLEFFEADDFHPPANVAKMAAGEPLTEQDRAPWIDRLAAAVNEGGARDVVIACSALTELVRARLRGGIAQPVRFIHLVAPAERIEQRLLERRGHFMKSGMLASQLATLEPPRDAAIVDADRPLHEVVQEVAQLIRGSAENTRGADR